VVGFTTGLRGKVPGKTCEKRIRNNNNTNTLLWAEHIAEGKQEMHKEFYLLECEY
jgi:hypothetical protein